MKKPNSLLIVAATLMASAFNTFAQSPSQPQSQQPLPQRPTREQLAEKQAQRIVHELALDDKVAQEFKSTWLDYQKEMWAIGMPPLHKKQTKAGEETDAKPERTWTEAEAEQAIKQRMEHSRKILDLREKYYAKYSKFLTQKQIARVYELEHKAMKRMEKNLDAKGKKGNKDCPKPQGKHKKQQAKQKQ